MTQRVTFHFYEVQLNLDENLFNIGEDHFEMLLDAMRNTSKPDNVYPLSGHQAFCKHIDGNLFCLEKHRKSGLPTIGKLTDDEERQIELGDDETLIEKNFFIVSDQGFIIYQEKKEGFRAQSLAGYLQKLLGVDGGIRILQILTRDAYERLMSFGYIKSMDLEFASPSDRELRDWGVRLNDRIIYNRDAGVKVGIQIKLDRKRPLTRALKDLITGNFQRNGGSVHKLTIKGSREEEDNLQEVNLSSDALEEKVILKAYPPNVFENGIIGELERLMNVYEDEVDELLGNGSEDH